MSIKPSERLTNLNDSEFIVPDGADARLVAGIEQHLRNAAIKRAQERSDTPTTEGLLNGLQAQAHDESHQKMNQRFKEEL